MICGVIVVREQDQTDRKRHGFGRPEGYRGRKIARSGRRRSLVRKQLTQRYLAKNAESCREEAWVNANRALEYTPAVGCQDEPIFRLFPRSAGASTPGDGLGVTLSRTTMGREHPQCHRRRRSRAIWFCGEDWIACFLPKRVPFTHILESITLLKQWWGIDSRGTLDNAACGIIDHGAVLTRVSLAPAARMALPRAFCILCQQ